MKRPMLAISLLLVASCGGTPDLEDAAREAVRHYSDSESVEGVPEILESRIDGDCAAVALRAPSESQPIVVGLRKADDEWRAFGYGGFDIADLDGTAGDCGL